jgi:hypothetical protein
LRSIRTGSREDIGDCDHEDAKTRNGNDVTEEVVLPFSALVSLWAIAFFGSACAGLGERGRVPFLSFPRFAATDASCHTFIPGNPKRGRTQCPTPFRFPRAIGERSWPSLVGAPHTPFAQPPTGVTYQPPQSCRENRRLPGERRPHPRLLSTRGEGRTAAVHCLENRRLPGQRLPHPRPLSTRGEGRTAVPVAADERRLLFIVSERRNLA